jgi:hypothetical protein
VVGPRVVVSSFHYARPFYSFYPRYSLGFGLWVGFPVAYPYWYGYGGYPYPYAYSYPYYYPSYGYPSYPAYPSYPSDPSYPSYPSYPSDPSIQTYPPSGQPYPPSGGQPGQQQGNYGGVSFEITPTSAAVYVDDSYVGTVGDFSPNSTPLTLTPGRHHIEVRAPGYQTMVFDTDIRMGQVIPYRGEMQRQ